MASAARPVDLVLEGGGVKGIGLVGAAQVLDEAGYRFERLAGTSAGAIVAAFLAAGFPVGEVTARMRRLDLRRFRDPTMLSRVPLVGRTASLLLRRGLYEGRELEEWLRPQLAEQGVRTFGDLRLRGEAAEGLPSEAAYRLVVLATDLSLGRQVRLPWDYRRLYGLDPDEQDVARAVRTSAAIPFFFRPVTLDHGATGATSYLVDGGLLSSFPVDVFDVPRGQVPRWPTFGIKLSARPSAQTVPRAVTGPVSYLRAVVETLLGATDRAHLDDPCVLARTMFVDTLDVRSTDFDLDAALRARLEANGRSAAERFLERWDEEAYRALCA
jgi:NTE family protein